MEFKCILLSHKRQGSQQVGILHVILMMSEEKLYETIAAMQINEETLALKNMHIVIKYNLTWYKLFWITM